MSLARLPYPTPRHLYVRCLNERDQPADYVGDWPRRGQLYAADLRYHRPTGLPQFHLHGFYAAAPYGGFAVSRFRIIAEVWLN